VPTAAGARRQGAAAAGTRGARPPAPCCAAPRAGPRAHPCRPPRRPPAQAQPSASRREVAGAAAALLAGALFAGAPPAHAFLGLGGDPEAAAKEYTDDTVRAADAGPGGRCGAGGARGPRRPRPALSTRPPRRTAAAAAYAKADTPRPRPPLPAPSSPPQAQVLQLVTGALTLEKDAEDRDERIAEVRKTINTWVAKYRRNDKFAGRPSYGCAGVDGGGGGGGDGGDGGGALPGGGGGEGHGGTRWQCGRHRARLQPRPRQSTAPPTPRRPPRKQAPGATRPLTPLTDSLHSLTPFRHERAPPQQHLRRVQHAGGPLQQLRHQGAAAQEAPGAPDPGAWCDGGRGAGRGGAAAAPAAGGPLRLPRTRRTAPPAPGLQAWTPPLNQLPPAPSPPLPLQELEDAQKLLERGR
jgi:hypothetical protein